MNLALFDLDHTLIPFDSGMAWTRFLAGHGALPPDAESTYLASCQAYVDGTLDIRALHRTSVLPLARFEPAVLRRWAAGFEAAMAPLIPPAMRALVQSHIGAGDLCAIVTATTRLIAEPFAHLLGIADVVATESALRNGRPTGEIVGEPCYREHKVDKVDAWLTGRGVGSKTAGGTGAETGAGTGTGKGFRIEIRSGDAGAPTLPPALAGFERSWFYSDSFNDLPLLQAVSNPVAVRPDARLRAHALRAGWPIL